ncbi:hypothetical protein O6H91_05G063200 [Diphasiastrum complanatum]|uniref:Uncharacterized protein n=1 Tax=Diphasiastrum complanatum TaxID=34168 RepID=A0ACC2DPC6_DIPCM|nr:hypothetical protein O6H91_05G063200 [Diphasiastrum complanatum]
MYSSRRYLASKFAFIQLVLWLLCSSICFGVIKGATAEDVTVTVDGTVPISRVSDKYLCATIDWRSAPATCASDGLSPLLIRLGGTLQDAVIYDIGSTNRPCLPFTPDPSQHFGVAGGCLNMTRWDDFNDFFNQTGASVAFGLNVLYGRENNFTAGQWDPSNTQAFINYTVSKGYDMFAWELGNELDIFIPASNYARDARTFRNIVDNIYQNSPTKPLLVAPDALFHKDWYQEFLQSIGPEVINVTTYHIYNLGKPNTTNLEDRIFNATFLDQVKTTFINMSILLKPYGSSIQPWIGEAGGVVKGGSPLISGTFVNSFWYLDQLGMAATYGTQVYCRQTLIGSIYGLLNKTTHEPNPDYYGAKLWKDLMGENVISANVTENPNLRAYAHCAKNDTGSATLLLINLSNTTDFNVSLILNGSTGCQEQRLEYHLTAPDENLRSQIILLNGKALDLSPDGQLPEFIPLVENSSIPISIVHTSIVYVKLLGVSLLACTQP